jgi:hypothetical protein
MSSIQTNPVISELTSQIIKQVVEEIQPYLLGLVICFGIMIILLIYSCIMVTFKNRKIKRIK